MKKGRFSSPGSQRVCALAGSRKGLRRRDATQTAGSVQIAAGRARGHAATASVNQDFAGNRVVEPKCVRRLTYICPASRERAPDGRERRVLCLRERCRSLSAKSLFSPRRVTTSGSLSVNSSLCSRSKCFERLPVSSKCLFTSTTGGSARWCAWRIEGEGANTRPQLWRAASRADQSRRSSASRCSMVSSRWPGKPGSPFPAMERGPHSGFRWHRIC